MPNAETGARSLSTHEAEEFLLKAAPLVAKIVRSQQFDDRRRFSVQDADDLTQEILLKLFQNLSSFDQTKPFEHWVARIAVNCCRDHKRRNRLRYTVEIEQIGWSQITITTELTESIDERQETSQLLRFIPSTDRVIVRLRFLETLTFEEIAKETGRTPASVKMQLSRAIRILKKHAKCR